MNGPQFFQTVMGRTFFEGTMPRIARSLELLTRHITEATKREEAENKNTYDPLTQSYVIKGFFSLPTDQLDATYNEGETEIVDKVQKLAEVIDKAYDDIIKDNEYTEVFAYEVAEPMGIFIGNHYIANGSLPSKTVVYEEAAKRIHEGCDQSVTLSLTPEELDGLKMLIEAGGEHMTDKVEEVDKNAYGLRDDYEDGELESMQSLAGGHRYQILMTKCINAQ